MSSLELSIISLCPFQYAVFLTLILIVKLVVVVLSLTASVNTLMDYIYMPVSDYATDREIQEEFDYMQTQVLLSNT